MPLERKTLVDQVEVTRDGTLQVRLVKCIVDGESIVASQYHRLTIEPWAALDAQIESVGANLAAMGEASPDAKEWDRVRRIVSVEHDKQTIKRFRDRKAAAG